MNRRVAPICLFASSALLIAAWANPARCGGFVCFSSGTLRQEIASAEITVIARLVETLVHPEVDFDTLRVLNLEQCRSRFQIVAVLKGEGVLGDTREIEARYLGEEPPGTQFLIQGARGEDFAWGDPRALNDRTVSYLRRLAELPESGAERLRFFLSYLPDEDSSLSSDAYVELSRIPYPELKSLRKSLDSDELVARITDARTKESHQWLYLTLFAIAEQPAPRPEVIDMLEARLAAPATDESKGSREGEIACYLALKGPDGLPLIEELFLTNKDCHFSNTYAAIVALRFHGNEEAIIPKERLLIALQPLLDRPDLADLVIPDLARWEDWSVMERLVTLFKESDDSSWVRVPVIQYLQACPLPEATTAIEELTQIHPDAVKRANFLAAWNASAKQPPTPGHDTTDEAPRDKPAPEDGTSGEGT